MRSVFIGGCGRSGTTLLGSMLGSHSTCVATPESKFKFTKSRAYVQLGGAVEVGRESRRISEHTGFRLWNIDGATTIAEQAGVKTYPQLLLAIVEAYARARGRAGAGYWIDHTPANIAFAPQLFDWFPDAKVLHLVRDGRAVVASVMPLDWGPNTALSAVHWWIEKLAHGLAVESRFGPTRVKRVHFEQLLNSPDETLQGICSFLGIEFEPGMTAGSGFHVLPYTRGQHALVGSGPDESRAEAWRRELTRRQLEIVESVAGNLLTCLGYQLEHRDYARKATKAEHLSSLLSETVMARRNLARQWKRYRKSLATGDEG